MTGFPGGSAIKNPPANAEDEGWILGWDPNSEKTTTTTKTLLGRILMVFRIDFQTYNSRLVTPRLPANSILLPG